MSPAEVSACLVTRGDVSLVEILRSLGKAGIRDVVIWNNALEETDYSVYGRYHALAQCRHDVCYVQDDDCVLPPESIQALLDAYEPGVLVTNMPERFRPNYPESALVGFGAVFDRGLPGEAFHRYYQSDHVREVQGPEHGDLFFRECDAIFTALTPRKLLDLPYEDLPWASAPGRLWTTPGHSEQRARMLALVLAARDAVPT